jgi:subtilase family serine protease
MNRRVSRSIGRRLVPLSAAAIVALGVATVAASTATATATAARQTASSRMTPTIGAHPVMVKVGKVGSGTEKFTCEAVTAPLRCYTPQQMVNAYGWSQFKNRGKGETVVIIDAFQSPSLSEDLQAEDAEFGLAPPNLEVIAPQGLTTFNPDSADQQSWAGEITLDVNSVHIYAPQAHIILVLAKSDQDVDLTAALKFAVDNDLGNAISQSFGEAEECVAPTIVKEDNRLYKQAAHEGISVFASTGDNGAAQPTCNGKHLVLSAGYPATDPGVTAVGGTNLFLSPSGKWLAEVAWNDGFGESGGGISTLFAAPGFQHALGAPARVVPDVAYNAGVNGGLIVAFEGNFYLFGGTSAGSPAWASLAVDADQVAGHPLGLLNGAIYRLAQSKRYTSYFHDITIGTNRESVGGYLAGSGYDLVTGWGTPEIANLIPALAGTSSSS